MFIDTDSSGFLAVIAFIISVLSLWVFSSITVSIMFAKTTDLALSAKRRIQFLSLFLASSTTFYALKLIYDSGHLNFGWASLLQAIFYFCAFLFLTSVIGMQFRDTFWQYRWKEDEENRFKNIRQTLIDSGYIKVSLRIVSIQTFIFDATRHPPNWQNAFFVIFETGNKSYGSIIDQKVKNVLNVEERQPSQSSEDLLKKLSG